MVTVLLRVYYSSYHHWAAQHFTRLALDIENTHTGEPGFDIRHRSYVTNAILSSVAFMEAAINELLQDAVDGNREYMFTLGENVCELIKSYWSISEEQNRSTLGILDKYQIVLNFSKLKLFSRGEQPYQDAQLLIRLRNYLVHYKPEEVSKSIEHRLEKQLRGKFAENPMMPHNPFIPDRCLGAGCAQWSVTTSRSYLDQFFEKINVIPHYQKVKFGDP